jgi:uncharacterized membrane protein (UPF0182 family)
MSSRSTFRRRAGGFPSSSGSSWAYQNQVVMHETLEAALAELFGGKSAPRAVPEPTITATAATADTSVRVLAEEARRRYQAALQAQRDIDWARYGEEMRRLGEVLERMGADR